MSSDNVTSPEVKRAADALMSPVNKTGARPTKDSGPKPRVGSFLLSWLAVITGAACVIASGYMFYRFAENDFGVAVLLSAFALCFGVGALAYGPLFIMARLISNGRKNPTKRQALWVLAFSIPWLIAGEILITYPNSMRYLGIFAIGLSVLFILWAIRHLIFMSKNREK